MTLTAGCETNCEFQRHGCFSPFVISHPVCCRDISRTNAACNDAHQEDEGGFRSESALLLTPESPAPCWRGGELHRVSRFKQSRFQQLTLHKWMTIWFLNRKREVIQERNRIRGA